jgi:hypothetical protein
MAGFNVGDESQGEVRKQRTDPSAQLSPPHLSPMQCDEQPQSGVRSGELPFHVFLQALRARIHTPRLFLSSGQLFLFLDSHRVGNRAAFSDSRSNFHTRVGYRTNVCRRRLASDSARASEGTPAQGVLEDHHDRPAGSPPEMEQLNSSCHRSPHLLTDGPYEAGKLSRDRGDDDCGLLASGDQ